MVNCHESCISSLVYLVVLMGRGTSTLLLILLSKKDDEIEIDAIEVIAKVT